MTDHLPPHPDDEPDAIDLLVSRALDDDLTVEERAVLDADDDAVARLAQMRAARDLVARVDPPSPDLTDAAVAAALRVADETWPTEVVAPAGSPTGTVVPFRRRRGWAAAAPWLGAVAAAGAIVVGVASLGGGSDDQIAEKVPEASIGADERTGAAADTASTEVLTEMATTGDTFGAAEPAAENGGGEDPDVTAMSAPEVGDLPAEALPVVPADGLSAYASERSIAVAPVCDDTAELLLAEALLGEPPVLVEVVRDAAGIVAYDLADCAEVARADLG